METLETATQQALIEIPSQSLVVKGDISREEAIGGELVVAPFAILIGTAYAIIGAKKIYKAGIRLKNKLMDYVISEATGIPLEDL